MRQMGGDPLLAAQQLPAVEDQRLVPLLRQQAGRIVEKQRLSGAGAPREPDEGGLSLLLGKDRKDL